MFLSRKTASKSIERLIGAMYSELPKDVETYETHPAMRESVIAQMLNRLYEDLAAWAEHDEEQGKGLDLDNTSLEILAVTFHEPYYRQFFGKENRHKLKHT